MNKIYLLLIPILILSACTQEQGTTTTTIAPVGPDDVKITISSYPTAVRATYDLAITWRIDGPERSIDHTAVHYGPESKPDAQLPSDYPNVSRIQKGTIPAVYSTIMVINEPGTYYFRAHAIVDGKHFWTDEKQMIVTAEVGLRCSDTCSFVGYKGGYCRETCMPNEISGVVSASQCSLTCCCTNETLTITEPNEPVNFPSTTIPQKFTIEADDYGFYPSGDVSVAKNSNVEITFKVRNTNVYYGGLQIKSEKFDTGSIAPGGEKTVSFVADKTFTFTSYWPLSGVKKADGQVVS